MMDTTPDTGLRRRKIDRSISEEPKSEIDDVRDGVRFLSEEKQTLLLSEPENEEVFVPDSDDKILTKASHVRLNKKLNIILGDDENKDDTAPGSQPSNIPISYAPTKEEFKVPTKLNTWEFIWLELTRGYSLESNQDRYTEKRRKVYAFMRVPYELEKFLFYGFLHCLDAFCYVFTFLPIRLFMALFGSLLRIREWTAAETCDLLKIVIIIIASFIMQAVDTSVLYHLVRGQGVIKLYIFYNMLEVADKLFSSFGQDILDALLWTASERGGKRRFISTILHCCAAIIYAALHALLVLFQATTLNVAFNSYNQSLLTIMLSNNFVELKGAVFKKFAKPNLFQMACSDCRERFHTIILLIVVVLRNMTAVNWKFEHLIEMVPDLLMVVIAELIVDWLKHAFITKFNEISAEVYQDFTITLAFDVVKSHEINTFTDFSDQVSRRMGFIPIPITIMLIRVIGQSIDFSTNVYTIVFVFIWICLCTTKIVNGVFLHDRAVDYVIQYKKLQEQADHNLYRKRMLSAKSKSVPNSPRLSLIDFSDVLTQAAQGPAKGLTASDLLAQWNELANGSKLVVHPQPQQPHVDELPPRSPTEEMTPRRSQSMADFMVGKNRRENSLPPTVDEELAEEEQEKEPKPQTSPKRRVTECESLSDVQAYTLLKAEGTNEIQS